MGYYVNVEKGVNIYIEDINPSADKTILFIHGWPANHQMFEYQFNQLPALGYRCIGLDLRGFGKSSNPWESYSYNRMADDIRVIIDTLQLENITLLGHSMGGAVAIRYMSRYKAHQVDKLALAGAAAPMFTMQPDFPYGTPITVVNELISDTYNDRPKMVQDFGNLFYHRHLSESFQHWFQNLCLTASGHATAQCLETLRDEDLRSDLTRIHTPTLILHGKWDLICPYELGELMYVQIQNSMLVPFEYSGHGLFYEEKEKFNEELARFIG